MDQKIVPHLWFDGQAREAAEFYTGLLPDSYIVRTGVIRDTPSGDVEAVDFVLAGQPFEAISAGPNFMFTPTISLMVTCDSADEVDRLWAALSQGGQVMMEVGAYPFSPRYGWVADRYGLSWQLIWQPEARTSQKINISLLFSGEVNGKAEEAARFYAGAFPGGTVDLVSRYAPGEAQAAEAKANYVGFTLMGQSFVAMDNSFDTDDAFNEALSLIVYCDTQDEVDEYWAKLSHVPEAEMCGWVKDRYGISWQIVPRVMGRLMTSGDEAQTRRLMQTMLTMKKLDIATLKRAFDGE